MIACKRLASLCVAAVTLIVVGFHSQSAWMESQGIDWWNVPEMQRINDAETERADRLDRQAVFVLHRTTAKSELVRAVIDGKMSLLEAAGWFRELNKGNASCPATRYASPEGSEAERLCLQVLSWVRGELADRPSSESEPLYRRLQAEFEDLRKGEGGLHLPGE
jgi:hypothetical protein